MSSRKATGQTAVRRTILIVDDHPLLREGLAATINREADLTVSAQAGTAAEAIRAVSQAVPDIVVADLSLPDKSGLELIKDLHALHPNLPVLVISMHEESFYAERVLRAGARGYLMKHESQDRLIQAIRDVLRGQVCVSKSVSGRLLQSLVAPGFKRSYSPVERLTDREFEVFQLLGRGKSTREIARHLHISSKTVDAHRIHIRAKLDLHSVPELIRFAVHWTEAEARPNNPP